MVYRLWSITKYALVPGVLVLQVPTGQHQVGCFSSISCPAYQVIGWMVARSFPASTHYVLWPLSPNAPPPIPTKHFLHFPRHQPARCNHPLSDISPAFNRINQNDNRHKPKFVKLKGMRGKDPYCKVREHIYNRGPHARP